jgi:hypothetical protein
MKIFKAMGSGFCRSSKAWMGILIIWLGSLLIVSLIALPMKAFLNAGFGTSMITEKLQDGIDVEVLGDLGSGFRNMLTTLPGILLLLILFGILLNAFLTGGLFDKLKVSSARFSGSEFFRTCARNFWSFLVISLVISIIVLLLGLLIIALPIGIVRMSDSGSETALFLTVIISISVFLPVTMIFLLVADYARAWQVTKEKQACLNALGFGFRRTFRTFLSSFPMMMLLVALQLIFIFVVLQVIGRWKPDTGGGVFLLFLISQILFYFKIVLRAWRYGSVTSLMEQTDSKNQPVNTILNSNYIKREK